MMQNFLYLSLSLKEVFSKIRYFAAAFSSAFLIFIIALFIRNIPLVTGILTADFFTIGFKTKLTLLLTISALLNTSILTLFLLISVSVLFGINISFFVFYFARRGLASKKEAGGVLAGVTSGLFGAGCASCGGLLLSSILSSVGAAGILVFLPLAGEELTILGIVFLILSIFWLSKSIQTSGICEVQP